MNKTRSNCCNAPLKSDSYEAGIFYCTECLKICTSVESQQPDVREEVDKIFGIVPGEDSYRGWRDKVLDLIHSQRKEAVEQFAKQIINEVGEVSYWHDGDVIHVSQDVRTILAQWEESHE